MKKLSAFALTALVATILCGCSNGGASRIVDCYQIEVKKYGLDKIFSGTYYSTYSHVFEYKSERGDSIYINQHITGNNSTTSQKEDAVIRVYQNRYKSDYQTYFYVGFIGFLTKEYNYYFDLDNRIIDSETKWKEYLYDTIPTDLPENQQNDEKTYDNKRAYSCAKKKYYQIENYTFYDQEANVYFYNIKLDLEDSSLERHTYTDLGENCVVTYKEKWF